MTSTFPSTSLRTFARASSAPLMPQRYDSVPGYGARGHRQRADLTHRTDPLAVDDDDAVLNRFAAVAVDERATDQRLHGPRLAARTHRETEHERSRNCTSTSRHRCPPVGWDGLRPSPTDVDTAASDPPLMMNKSAIPYRKPTTG